jgi:hypothetical protein
VTAICGEKTVGKIQYNGIVRNYDVKPKGFADMFLLSFQGYAPLKETRKQCPLTIALGG